MNINVETLGYFMFYYMLSSIILAIVSYPILKENRKCPSKDALIVLFLMVIPPFNVIALFVFYLIENKKVD